MKTLLVLILTIFVVGCATSLDPPVRVTGKYMFPDGTCVVYMSDSASHEFRTWRTRQEYCTYEIGHEFK